MTGQSDYLRIFEVMKLYLPRHAASSGAVNED
jgi:hypothetical protein